MGQREKAQVCKPSDTLVVPAHKLVGIANGRAVDWEPGDHTTLSALFVHEHEIEQSAGGVWWGVRNIHANDFEDSHSLVSVWSEWCDEA